MLNKARTLGDTLLEAAYEMLCYLAEKSEIAFMKLKTIFKAANKMNNDWKADYSNSSQYNIIRILFGVPPVFVTSVCTARVRSRTPALGFAAVHLMMQNTSEKNLKIYIMIILDKTKSKTRRGNLSTGYL